MKKKAAQIWEYILGAICGYFVLVTLANTFGASVKGAFMFANMVYIFLGICLIYYFITERKK